MLDSVLDLLSPATLAQLPLGWALLLMFALALLAATVLPLGSEVAFVLLLHTHPEWQWAFWLLATAGNTLGGAITYAMGRGAQRLWQRERPLATQNPRAMRWLQRHGPMACALSWLPAVGDALCAMAGWLRLPAVSCVGWMAVGKGARYAGLLMLGT